jgi:hypothetical protein
VEGEQMKKEKPKTSRKTPRSKRKKKARKGALIKGMTSKLPSKIIDNPVFKKVLKEIMKRYSGIYALYRKDRLYYIGLTTNLFGRIKDHLQDRHAGKWDKFAIFRIRRVDYLKDIETLITQLVHPRGNLTKGKVPRTADLTHILRSKCKGPYKEVKEIMEAL